MTDEIKNVLGDDSKRAEEASTLGSNTFQAATGGPSFGRNVPEILLLGFLYCLELTDIPVRRSTTVRSTKSQIS